MMKVVARARDAVSGRGFFQVLAIATNDRAVAEEAARRFITVEGYELVGFDESGMGPTDIEAVRRTMRFLDAPIEGVVAKTGRAWFEEDE